MCYLWLARSARGWISIKETIPDHLCGYRAARVSLIAFNNPAKRLFLVTDTCRNNGRVSYKGVQQSSKGHFLLLATSFLLITNRATAISMFSLLSIFYYVDQWSQIQMILQAILEMCHNSAGRIYEIIYPYFNYIRFSFHINYSANSYLKQTISFIYWKKSKFI